MPRATKNKHEEEFKPTQRESMAAMIEDVIKDWPESERINDPACDDGNFVTMMYEWSRSLHPDHDNNDCFLDRSNA